MNRRTFLSLLGITTANGFPYIAWASPLSRQEETAVLGTTERIDQPEDAWDDFNSSLNIKVIGVGNAGCNAVDHMIRQGITGVEFIAANSDAKSLEHSTAATRIQLGQSGLSTGADSELGRIAAMESSERITESLRDAHIVFIVAGMGGGTGTGAAPVFANIAKRFVPLSIGIVIKPFGFEGELRRMAAEAGIAKFARHVDALMVFSNDQLTNLLGDDAQASDALSEANNVLHNAVSGITDILTNDAPLVGIDFEDVRTVLHEPGITMMGHAQASGVERAKMASERAIASPLLTHFDLSAATGLLVNITANRRLKMSEVNDVMTSVRKFVQGDAHLTFGVAQDDGMGDNMRVSVFFTGVRLSRSAAGPLPANDERLSFNFIDQAARRQKLCC